MPYIKRLVSLDDRSGKCGLPLPRSGSRRRRDDAVEIAAGDAFVRVCRLLACLAHHADGLFEDLLDECRRVVDRTKRLDDRLRDGLADRVAQLDVRTAGRRMYLYQFDVIFLQFIMAAILRRKYSHC